MKRHLLIVAVFLLAGAVVNVAVAWGCALWSPLPPPERMRGPVTATARSVFKTHANVALVETQRNCGALWRLRRVARWFYTAKFLDKKRLTNPSASTSDAPMSFRTPLTRRKNGPGWRW